LKELSLSEIKTKTVVDSLKSMKLDDQKVLFVLPKFNEVAAKSLRNIA
jgi:ribosomal protein L4